MINWLFPLPFSFFLGYKQPKMFFFDSLIHNRICWKTYELLAVVVSPKSVPKVFSHLTYPKEIQYQKQQICQVLRHKCYKNILNLILVFSMGRYGVKLQIWFHSKGSARRKSAGHLAEYKLILAFFEQGLASNQSQSHVCLKCTEPAHAFPDISTVFTVKNWNKQTHIFSSPLHSCCAPQCRRLCLRRRTGSGLSPSRCVPWRKPTTTWGKRWRPWNGSYARPNERQWRSRASASNSSTSQSRPAPTPIRTLPRTRRSRHLKRSSPGI